MKRMSAEATFEKTARRYVELSAALIDDEGLHVSEEWAEVSIEFQIAATEYVMELESDLEAANVTAEVMEHLNARAGVALLRLIRKIFAVEGSKVWVDSDFFTKEDRIIIKSALALKDPDVEGGSA